MGEWLQKEVKNVSKIYEDAANVEMEWMSAMGLANAHSMAIFMSEFVFSEFDDAMRTELMSEPKMAYDAGILSASEFTQGGFCRMEKFGVEWFAWGGLGG